MLVGEGDLLGAVLELLVQFGDAIVDGFFGVFECRGAFFVTGGTRIHDRFLLVFERILVGADVVDGPLEFVFDKVDAVLVL